MSLAKEMRLHLARARLRLAVDKAQKALDKLRNAEFEAEYAQRRVTEAEHEYAAAGGKLP